MGSKLREAVLRAAELIANALEDELGDGIDPWIDQHHSPLGKRRHCELVRLGELAGYKPDRSRVLVRKSEIDRYIGAHPVGRPRRTPAARALAEPSAPVGVVWPATLDAIVAEKAARLGFPPRAR